MTPDEIRTVVRQTGTRIDVAIGALTGVGGLFASFFPDGRFVIDPVTARTETADGVRVTGTGASGPFTGMALDVTFSAAPGSVHVVVRAAGAADWTFSRAFPALRGSIFDTLRFGSPVLVLDSTATAMTFGGVLVITTPMVPLDLLMPGVTHTLTGKITMVSGREKLGFPTTPVPDILLFGPEKLTLDLGLFTLTELRYEITADPVFNYHQIDWSARCSITVTAAVPITVAGTRHDVLIDTRIFGWGGSLLFTGDFRALGDISLADAAGFAGQSALPVPFGLDVTSPVRLTKVSMQVTPAALSIDSISLTLETQEEWTVVPGLLDLQAIDLTFRIDSPLSSPRPSALLTALFGIGKDGTLEITADTLTGTLGGALREGDGPLSMREVYTGLTGADPSSFPDLSVYKFDLGLTIPTKESAAVYHAFVGLAGDWHLTDSLSFTDVLVSVRHDQGTTFEALALFGIGGVAVKVTAAYDPAPEKRQWQFTGETGPGQQLPIGRLFQDLADRFGAIALPAPIAQLVIENLGMEVSTGTPRRLFLTGEALFPLDTAEVDVTLALDTEKRSLTGALVATVPTAHGPFTPRFDLRFAQQPTATLFTAAYSHAAGDPVPALKDLVAALLPSAAAFVPDGLTVDLKDAFLAVDGPTYLFGADLAVTVDLSHLPVVGDHLGAGEMGFDPLRLVAASAALAAAEVTAVNGMLPDQVAKLPDGDLPAGFLVSGLLKLGPLEQGLTLPVAGAQPAAPDVSATDNPPQTTDDALWYKVQRSFGPIHIQRVGMRYDHPPGEGAELAVLLDASISAAGLTLTLTGLEAGVALSDPTAMPTFGLAGLDLAYASGPVEIGGSFLKNTVEFEGATYPAYGGAATIRTADLSIGAIGSYLQLPQGPSLFVYAFLDKPIGGPAFFFVRGLAAGFGYNRRLIPPALDQLADFPLIADVVKGSSPAADVGGQLARLNPALPPSPGDLFLVFGIRFTSFGMVDSFLLLTAGFGHGFEMNLLGLSTLVLPAPEAGAADVTPIAEVQLALRGTFAPDAGVFSIAAQLTPNSYVLSRDCRLTGGFAFSTWFAGPNSGDFVLSVGGYHPHFAVPAHYPAVPRLGFNWQVNSHLQLTGSAYYALTPSALMAGGSLSATWHDGSLQAWFDASMDFLIAWQPYHYEASVHIAIGASYTFSFFGSHTISAHVGADVEFWGPDFGGRAHIDLSIISFTISFGASGSAGPAPIPWSTFQATLLPPHEEITTVSLAGGALAPGAGTDLGVVDPHGLVLVTDSVIPSTRAVRGPDGNERELSTGTAGTTFGVSPMDVASATSTHRIEITKDGKHVDRLFDFTPVGKQLPSALWGSEFGTSLNRPQLVGELLTGYTVRPLPPKEPAVSATLPSAVLQSATPLFTEPDAIRWAAAEPVRRTAQDVGAITAALRDPAVAEARAALVDAVLGDVPIDLAGFGADQFLEVPQVVTHG
ncbi:hypothetical protein PV396_08005 [Streptomyces sp. ME02-8801-2C]|uniref:DUF6603 domain-containing protein n=1 Tax=Streptomyces sp. ME02-8801-2C TaxID=3028680 RepID=UPI0029A3753F|nr:DUF6603 domain-containing protein [Streptomyces sp. ME02-8801-2C]MDX3451888.1 hypothetical protein [Streptomyces sp. ME02-8801-2C]